MPCALPVGRVLQISNKRFFSTTGSRITVESLTPAPVLLLLFVEVGDWKSLVLLGCCSVVKLGDAPETFCGSKAALTLLCSEVASPANNSKQQSHGGSVRGILQSTRDPCLLVSMFPSDSFLEKTLPNQSLG